MCHKLVKIEYLSMNTKQFWQNMLFCPYVFNIYSSFIYGLCLHLDSVGFGLFLWKVAASLDLVACSHAVHKLVQIAWILYVISVSGSVVLELYNSRVYHYHQQYHKSGSFDNMSLLWSHKERNRKWEKERTTIIMMMITKCVTLLTPFYFNITS